MSCPFKDIFGAPGTGVHSIRIADIAVVDTAMTAAAAWFIYRKHFWTTFIILLIIGEVFHYLFCVDTKVIRTLRQLRTLEQR